MKVGITDKKSNPVLRREEVSAAVDFEGGPTPSIVALRAELAKSLNVSEDRIEVARLLSATGSPSGIARVRVWASAELVPKPKEKKKPAAAEGK